MRIIQINQCTQEELEWLPGIGPATAKKIIEARPIETVTALEQIVPPSAWLKIDEAGVEFAFGADGEKEEQEWAKAFGAVLELNPANLTDEEVAELRAKWEEAWSDVSLQKTPLLSEVPALEPAIILQEPEPMTLRRVLPGQPLKENVGAQYLCVWNMRWGPDGAAYQPRDEPVQSEIEDKLSAYNIGIQFAHYRASVRVNTNSYGPIPVVLFEIIKDTEEAESGEERDRQGDGQGD